MLIVEMSVLEKEIDERVRELVASRLEVLESTMIERMRRQIEAEMFEKVKRETSVKLEKKSSEHVVAEDTLPRVRVAQQIRSDGAKRPPTYNGVERGDVFDSWLSIMDAHVKVYASVDNDQSILSEYDVALSFLELHPRRVAERLYAELDGKLSWRVLRAELVDKFGDQKSSFVLLRELKSIKQSGRNATDYSLEFERKLDALLSLNWCDTLTAATAFLEGFDDDVRMKLIESLLGQGRDPMSELILLKPSEAIKSLTRLARLREELASLMPAGKPAVAARVAVAEVESVSRSASTVRRPFAGRETDEAKLLRLDSVVKSIVRKHNIPIAVVQQRVLKNLCGLCGSYGHRATECESSAKAATAPVRSPAPSSSVPLPPNSMAH